MFICRRERTRKCLKKKQIKIFISESLVMFCVIRLGLEPRTPTLKELCFLKPQKASLGLGFLTQPAEIANLRKIRKNKMFSLFYPQFTSWFTHPLVQQQIYFSWQSYRLCSTLATVCTKKFEADANYFPRLRIGYVYGYVSFYIIQNVSDG